MSEESDVLGPVQVFIEVGLMFIGYMIILFSWVSWSSWSVVGFVAGGGLVASGWLYERVCKLENEGGA